MSEVDKMYRNAHVYPRVYGDITKETFENKVFNMADMCNEAFTAEKQIYLIQFLSIDRIVTIFYEDQQIYISVCPNNPHDDRQICECGASWVEVLARVINSYWLLFSEEERKQIKEILSE